MLDRALGFAHGAGTPRVDPSRTSAKMAPVASLPVDDDAPRSARRPNVVVGSGLLTALLVLLMLTPPAPYAIESPGPTVDTLGEVDGKPLIVVDGAPTYPTEGALVLTTVETRGGPRNPVDLLRVVRAWLSGRDVVVPVEQVYPRDLSPDDLADLLAAQMTSSQENAVVAALTELGYEVPAELVVAGTVTGTGADGVLAEGDVVLAAAGTSLPTFQALVDLLRETPPGTPVPLDVRRGERVAAVEVVTGPDEEGGSVLGVYFDPVFDLPVDVRISIEEIGGPSAGLVFALGVVDVLTPGAMTGGERIAGTGTIAVDGSVGRISSVGLKVAAARRDGATHILVPEENCADAERSAGVGGPRVVPVTTLSGAREAATAIGERRTDDVASCAR